MDSLYLERKGENYAAWHDSVTRRPVCMGCGEKFKDGSRSHIYFTFGIIWRSYCLCDGCYNKDVDGVQLNHFLFRHQVHTLTHARLHDTLKPEWVLVPITPPQYTATDKTVYEMAD